MEIHPYFRRSRRHSARHALVTGDIVERVLRGRRAWLTIQPNGWIRYYGYSPELREWVRVIVWPDGRLFNAFVDENARDHVRRIVSGEGV